MSLVACASIGTDPARTTDLVRVSDRRIVMGVEARIVTWASCEPIARAATRAAFERMADLEQAISDYRPRSESMIAVKTVDEVVPVSRDLAEALRLSARWQRLSGGAFDPTIGPLTMLWRSARRGGGVPDERSIDIAATAVGWNQLEPDLEGEPPTVRFRTAGMQLDFGGLGKGLAADLALETMRSHGLPRTLVDVGGDLVAGDPPPGRAGWRVEVQTVEWDDRIVLELRHAAVATSGDVHQYVEVVQEDGERIRLGHLLDPTTGRPIPLRREATAVVEGSRWPGADADALASVLVVLGMEEAIERIGDETIRSRMRVLESISASADGADPSSWTRSESKLGGVDIGAAESAP